MLSDTAGLALPDCVDIAWVTCVQSGVPRLDNQLKIVPLITFEEGVHTGNEHRPGIRPDGRPHGGEREDAPTRGPVI